MLQGRSLGSLGKSVARSQNERSFYMFENFGGFKSVCLCCGVMGRFPRAMVYRLQSTTLQAWYQFRLEPIHFEWVLAANVNRYVGKVRLRIGKPCLWDRKNNVLSCFQRVSSWHMGRRDRISF